MMPKMSAFYGDTGYLHLSRKKWTTRFRISQGLKISFMCSCWLVWESKRQETVFPPW